MTEDPKPKGDTPLAGQGSMASINEPEGSTIGSNIPDQPEPDVMPNVTGLVPDVATIGDDSFTLDVEGEGFSAASVIVFAGHDEPTTFNEEDGTLSTGVDMEVWKGADVVPVQVRNGAMLSNTMDFTFDAEPAADTETSKRKTSSKPRPRK